LRHRLKGRGKWNDRHFLFMIGTAMTAHLMSDQRMHDDAASVFVTPAAQADERRFDAACEYLRRSNPVCLVNVPESGYPPFWAVTRHADITAIETSPERFTNAPLPMMRTRAQIKAQTDAETLSRTIVHMDGDEHRNYRALSAPWFSPRQLRNLTDRLSELATNAVDQMQAAGNACDFVPDVAKPYPLNVILAILGVPQVDHPLVYKLTQQFFGVDDPELSGSTTPQSMAETVQGFNDYFRHILEKRRSSPTDDLASAIVNGTIDGRPVTIAEALAYCLVIATAGHDTTSSCIAGGMRALIEAPEQMRLWQQEHQLLPTAVEEIIRWTTPIRNFMRTVREPCEVSGTELKPGDHLLLSYTSANRDEDVFEDPFQFDITRNPNRHLAFGTGPHVCLGARLARMELTAFFGALVPRLRKAELDGQPQLVHTVFGGGLKHFPVRYEITSVAGR
jgi:cytochrome P450